MTTVNPSYPDYPSKAAQLRADAATYLREAERLDREAAAETARARKLRRPVPPSPDQYDAQGAAYLVFQRVLGGKAYSYAAVLYGVGHQARVETTSRRKPPRVYTWGEFLEFVGENNWHTLQVMTVARLLKTEGGATVNDLGAMADAVVNDGCPEVVEPYHGKAGPVTPFGTGYGQY